MERTFQHRKRSVSAKLGASLMSFMLIALPAFSQSEGKEHEGNRHETKTPIKHLIVLIGENRTFDHVFATYIPKSEDSVSNLLSKGIINSGGTPGKHFKEAQQSQAVAPFKTKYFISLDGDEKAPYTILPEPTLNFSPTATVFPTGTPLNLLEAVEPSLEPGDEVLLTTGAATGFPQTFVQPDPDTRVANYNALPNGPFPLKGTNLPYDSYTGDTTHRLFEMSCLSWKWRKRSSAKITERTHEETTEALHAGRESRHSEEAFG